jgi:hypothetical protein
MLRITVDTNVLDTERIARIREATEGLDVDIAPTTVTVRERPGKPPRGEAIPETAVWGESRYGEAVWGPSPPVGETFTLGESRLGMAALGANESPSRFEAILAVISNGGFPKPGRREQLTTGERKQLRDAMILEAHAREGRDVLVSNDVRAFVGKDGSKRKTLEALCRTRIMTVDEFCSYAAELRRSG